MAEQIVAKIALSRALYAIDKPYDYLVSDTMADTLRPGMRVLVPFGNGNQPSDGIVLAMEKGNGVQLKNIISVLDDEPVLNHKLLKLALWMRERCFCTVYSAVKAMLPAGLYFSVRDCCRLSPEMSREAAYAAAGQSANAKKLLDMLYACGRSADMEQIRIAFGEKSPSAAIKLLNE